MTIYPWFSTKNLIFFTLKQKSMRNSILTFFSVVLVACIYILMPAHAWGAWTFTDINPPGSSTTPPVYNSGIDWRPQGDYALIANTDGLYRYDYPSGLLNYQAYPGENMCQVKWSSDGSYALITGTIYVYRYDHAASGFGTLTRIAASEIQGSGAYDITFYDVVFNPADPSDPPCIATNRETGVNKQIVIYRYDPSVSPQIYWDYSGGTSYVAGSGSMSYVPVSMSYQADGDYIVIANRYGDYSQGFHVYDPDQSTFPKDLSGAMQYFEFPGDVGNANTVLMSPVPGERFVLLKGNGEVIRLVQQGIPPGFVEDDTGSGWYTSLLSAGDSSYSFDGSFALCVERQMWTPNHMVMVFNEKGDFVQHLNLVSPGFTNQTLRIFAVAWHPSQPMGLMAGQNQWIFKFDTDEIILPTPTATPAVPSSSYSGIMTVFILLTCISIAAARKHGMNV